MHDSSSLPPSNVGIHVSIIHSQCTVLDNIDFGEQGTEVLLQNVPTVLYKIVVTCSKGAKVPFAGAGH